MIDPLTSMFQRYMPGLGKMRPSKLMAMGIVWESPAMREGGREKLNCAMNSNSGVGVPSGVEMNRKGCNVPSSSCSVTRSA